MGNSNEKVLDQTVISVIAEVMTIEPSEIKNMTYLKKGMTNDSFKFEVKDKSYIIRIPGAGTDKLISRSNEYDVYEVLKGKKISDNVVYISNESGIKITEFWETARVSDPFDQNDVQRCMKKLREFHNSNLKVAHTFNPFEEIEFYESLRQGKPSVFENYVEVKKNVLSLEKLVNQLPKNFVLAHIDSVSDNFLFLEDDVFVIDWEYAAMQDPHFDVGMFAIYSMYNREQTDYLIDSYFAGECAEETRIKIYCYIAIGGLLWSNWCEYKSALGVDFGEYALKQFDYAKEYYSIVVDELLPKTNLTLE
ncbi:Thiamine kinase [Carnobacterium iners]|uniref:Thiamine kinase n=1 Tax=Carnobacterium iners TaxID=1073423 RepID=A0A1X7N3X9_9LACT|nr:choline/ethanolamine kinase family protein [Carnobacterium iners]SEK61498.1 Thiamine kinase [Carnobacterium iners]SMH32073.1 Thiamine kinase [Carnobacterium iners]